MPKISSLPAMTSTDGADVAPIVDDSAGSTKKITLTKVKEFLQSVSGWITYAMLSTNIIRRANIDLTNWSAGQGGYSLQTGTFTTTSASIVDIGSTSFAQTVTTTGGKVFVFASMSCSVSTNTAQIYINVDGVNTALWQVSNTSANYVPMAIVLTGLSAGAHTFKLTVSIPGGATFTSTQFASRGISIVEI